jgi:EAL domain-containing protein (putative c-di-GMP-specific phosphodiesterase class I)
VTIAMDDFGSGYSSLSRIKLFSVQHIKIDRSMVQKMVTDPKDAEMCRSAIHLAHNLGAWITAEGVESEEQNALLKDMGCDVIQGYFIAKPQPADVTLQTILRINKGEASRSGPWSRG